MPYSLRNRKATNGTDAAADNLKKASKAIQAKKTRTSPKKKEILAKGKSKTVHVPSKDKTKSKGAHSKAPIKSIIRPSLPISDAKQRLIKELSFVKGKPSEIKQSANQKKKILLHKIDFNSSGKIQKKSRSDEKQLSKIVFGKIRQQPNIKPSIVRARANPAIIAIKTEIVKKAVLKEIRKFADKKSAAKSPVKSPLKGR